MLYAFALLFAMLWAVNLFLDRNPLYPPAVLCGMWSVTMCALLVAGDTFFAILPTALFVFLIGAVSFSAGGVAALLSCSEGRRIEADKLALRTLDWFLAVLVIGLPFFFQHMKAIADEAGAVGFLFAVRAAAVLDAESSERSFSVLSNLVVLSGFVALAMHIENDGTKPRRRRAWLAISVAMVYGAMTGSKGFATLVLLLLFITSLRSRLSIWSLAKAIGLFTVLFAAGLTFINFAYIEDVSYDVATPVVGLIQNYWLSSSVAFGHLSEHQTAVFSAHNPVRVVWETLNGLGARFEIPSIHAAYTDVGPGDNTNTYTIYFGYFLDFGWLGVVIAMAAFGYLSTLAYRKSANQIAMAFAASFLLAAIFTVHSDKFALGFNGYAKMLAFFWFVYYASPPLWRAWRAFWRLAVTH